MEYTAEIYNLSTKFYNDYPTIHYPEILTKSGRPYACLLIEYMDDLFICIPYRSNIRHMHIFLRTLLDHAYPDLDWIIQK